MQSLVVSIFDTSFDRHRAIARARFAIIDAGKSEAAKG